MIQCSCQNANFKPGPVFSARVTVRESTGSTSLLQWAGWAYAAATPL
jgi:hypothetical protein